ncbi:MAG: helix-turn-helix transcriptional regulator [Sandaracinaceae bacterium]
MDKSPHDPLQERYRQLIEDLATDLGHSHGWKKQVAERLGISPAHLTRVRKRQRKVSLEIARAAAERLGFDIAYFFSDEGLPHTAFRPDGLGSQPLQLDFVSPATLRAEARRVMGLAFADDFRPEEAIALARAVRALPWVLAAQRYEAALSDTAGERGASFHAAVTAASLAGGVLHWIGDRDDEDP